MIPATIPLRSGLWLRHFRENRAAVQVSAGLFAGLPPTPISRIFKSEANASFMHTLTSDIPEIEVERLQALKRFASEYIWWENAEEAIRFPNRVIAQVMELGIFEDTRELVSLFGEAKLVEVIQHSQAGWFTPRSWHYWHYRLHLAGVDEIPPLPVRRIF